VLHQVLREHLTSVLRGLAEAGLYLPRYVEQELRRYLPCGLLTEGFARVACRDCGDELLVAFSCKGRAFCPSCCARRMSDTAAHLVDRVLPEAPYRQWVLSYPFKVRLALARDQVAASRSCTILVSEIFRFQRRQARLAGERPVRPGAVSFTQRFGSKLNLNVHHHLVVADGVFVAAPAGAARFVPLPRPDARALEHILRRVVRRTTAMLVARGLLDDPDPDDPLARLHAEALQLPLRFVQQRPPNPTRLAAFLEGYSLEAGTHVHAHDRKGLEHLCRYGLRPPFSVDRLFWLKDGRVLLELRRPAPDGARAVVFTPAQFVRRLAAIVPPPRAHLTRYHGAFAARSKLRKALVPPPPPPTDPRPGSPSQPAPKLRERRLPWAQLLERVFSQDVLTCDKCGGSRVVNAILAAPEHARDALAKLGLPCEPLRLAKARDAPVQLDLGASRYDGVDPVFPD
jgi:hypothetical protein